MKRSPIKKKRSKPRPGRLQGEDLEVLRKECFDRAEGLCENCGVSMFYVKRFDTDPRGYEMAHKRGKRMWGDHAKQVQAFCFTCHQRSHNPKAVPPKERVN